MNMHKPFMADDVAQLRILTMDVGDHMHHTHRQVEAGRDELTLVVHYNVLDFTLQLLDEALVNAGFHLDRSLLIRLHRALIYYVEDTQVHNLRSPERLIKQSHVVYIQAYAHHPHGDRDDTPPELREFK